MEGSYRVQQVLLIVYGEESILTVRHGKLRIDGKGAVFGVILQVVVPRRLYKELILCRFAHDDCS